MRLETIEVIMLLISAMLLTVIFLWWRTNTAAHLFLKLLFMSIGFAVPLLILTQCISKH